MGTFVGASRVERAKLKAVELAIDEGWRLSLVLSFSWEACINLSIWLSVISIHIYFDLVWLVWTFGWYHAEADLLIR